MKPRCLALRSLQRRCASVVFVSLLVLGACDRDQPAPSTPPASPPTTAPTPTKPEIVLASDRGGSVMDVVQTELERARREGRELVVYVGAPWCEPCTRFHQAIEAGELDAVFPTLRLLEFDLERDEARLKQAGYRSRMIPLFAIPTPTGEASSLRIEGSIKGEGAVLDIAPRLRTLMAQAQAER
ncbi:hypothetical protein [Chondromyces crocatus]|uniref:Thioredoxin domain-containing protein n=1 Tax=Chondromyces crocatus TaxID=52 RepID=A0A0K1E6U0_CHOCO|nr:hypothetical protein [Chondromyces crocatus]AKT36575.1 uncharacterized protein CMC5_006930 [Chondromyces crocatus]